MQHAISSDDEVFLGRFQCCEFPAAEFKHREHIRLAYILLVLHEPESAIERMREALLAFLRHNEVDPAKYHVTLTRAWMMAVAHFMRRSARCDSSDAFVSANPVLLDQQIMLTHYSRETLFSDTARAAFVAPDREPIP